MDALAEAGFCYAQGIGCKKNLKKSAKFYRMAEAKGMSMVGNSWYVESPLPPFFESIFANSAPLGFTRQSTWTTTTLQNSPRTRRRIGPAASPARAPCLARSLLREKKNHIRATIMMMKHLFRPIHLQRSFFGGVQAVSLEILGSFVSLSPFSSFFFFSFFLVVFLHSQHLSRRVLLFLSLFFFCCFLFRCF